MSLCPSHPTIILWLLSGLVAAAYRPAARADEPLPSANSAPSTQTTSDLSAAVTQLNEILAKHWQQQAVEPAPLAPPAVLLRRLTLDLVGRVPTVSELQPLLAAASPSAASSSTAKKEASAGGTDQHAAAVERLLQSAEFPIYFGTVLDEFIQARQSGQEPFVDYLRQALQSRKSWDIVFREILVGTDKPEIKPAAALFVDKRVKDIDQLTVDTARAFFGVDISCARCHDHPLVPDWTQFHYYGLAAFLQRSSSDKKTNSASDSAKPVDPDSQIKFLARDGQERIAPMMFLTGQKTDSASTTISRRQLLVDTALSDQRFFSRAIVNRLWELFFGLGLVEPVDQMHSSNPAAIPELLDFLAADFAAHQYDLYRTVRLMVLSRAYRSDSHRADAEESDSSVPTHFAITRLRPLSPRQYAMSLLIGVGDELPESHSSTDKRLDRILGISGLTPARRLLELESALPPLVATIDPRAARFQSSAREALFMSNSEQIRKLIAPTGKNLATRITQIADDRKRIEQIYLILLQRQPAEDELQKCSEFLRVNRSAESASRPTDDAAAISDLIWSVVTSTEFRFNH